MLTMATYCLVFLFLFKIFCLDMTLYLFEILCVEDFLLFCLFVISITFDLFLPDLLVVSCFLLWVFEVCLSLQSIPLKYLLALRSISWALIGNSSEGLIRVSSTSIPSSPLERMIPLVVLLNKFLLRFNLSSTIILIVSCGHKTFALIFFSNHSSVVVLIRTEFFSLLVGVAISDDLLAYVYYLPDTTHLRMAYD